MKKARKLKSPQLLSNEEIINKMEYLKNWENVNFKLIKGIFYFKDFMDALNFVILVGEIAENIQHHPEIKLSWGKVELSIYTHDCGGLTELDFKFAQKVNEITLNS